jgi:hypothetical protein
MHHKLSLRGLVEMMAERAGTISGIELMHRTREGRFVTSVRGFSFIALFVRVSEIPPQ